MALRRREKNDRQLNKRNVRRPAGRTAEFFDLRETDMNTGSDRSTGPEYARGSYDSPESPRPYRERHRVEVNSQGSYQYRAENSTQPRGGYGDFNAGQQRIVRGNVPGNRGGQPVRTPGEEVSPDLLYDSRTAGNRRNAVRSSDRFQAGNTAAGRAASRRRAPAYDPFDYHERDYGGFRDEYDQILYEDGPEYDEPYDYGPDDSDEETAERREELSRRLRQRAHSRKAREQELRSLYIRIGAGAAVLLLLIILIVPRIFGGKRSGKNGSEDREQGQAVAEAQDSRDTAEQENQTQTSSAGENESEAEDSKAGEDDAAQSADPAQTQAADNAAVQTQTADNAAAQTQAADDAAAQTQTETGDNTAGGTQAQNGSEAGAVQTQESSVETGQESTAGTQAGAAQNTAVTDTPVAVTSTPVQTAAASGLYAKQDDWRFVLVNPWYLLPQEFAEVTTSTLPNGESVDSRCYGDLVKMLDDCRAAGGEPVVCSSYRPHAKQVTLFDDEVREGMASGMSKEQAEEEAGKEVAVPGTSEHELGLAVDLCDFDYQNLDDAQGDTATQKWLMQHCWEYGFILRYPKDKTALTGIIYEPWHYRYVGKEAAEEITKKGICLEEYLRQ